MIWFGMQTRLPAGSGATNELGSEPDEAGRSGPSRQIQIAAATPSRATITTEKIASRFRLIAKLWDRTLVGQESKITGQADAASGDHYGVSARL